MGVFGARAEEHICLRADIGKQVVGRVGIKELCAVLDDHAQLFFAFPERQLCLFALGNVLHGAQHPDRLPVRIPGDDGPIFDRRVGTILAKKAILIGPEFTL